MFRPTGFADLAGKRVGIFGYGVEGRATRRRLVGVADDVVLVDDAPGLDPDVLESHRRRSRRAGRLRRRLEEPGHPSSTRRRPRTRTSRRHRHLVAQSLVARRRSIARGRRHRHEGQVHDDGPHRPSSSSVWAKRPTDSAISANRRTTPTSTSRRGGSYSRYRVSSASTSTWRPVLSS